MTHETIFCYAEFLSPAIHSPDGVRRARKTIQWIVFTDERAGRPWVSQVSTPKSLPLEGVRRARKMIRWIVFTDERAGRP